MATQEIIPRKYFSGGVDLNGLFESTNFRTPAMTTANLAQTSEAVDAESNHAMLVTVGISPEAVKSAAMASQPKYPTPESVQAEFDRRLENGQDNYPSTLKGPGKNGGNRALYKAALKFGMLPDARKEFKYPEPKDAIKALEERLEKRQGISARVLAKSEAEGGEPALYQAVLRFNMVLPEGVENAMTKTVIAALKGREEKGLKNNPYAMNKPKAEGGYPALYRALLRLMKRGLIKRVGERYEANGDDDRDPENWRRYDIIFGEGFGIDEVRRLVDQIARQIDAVGDALHAGDSLGQRCCICAGETDVDRTGRLRIFFLLFLVLNWSNL